MRIKTSKQKSSNTVEYIEIFSGNDKYVISEPQKGFIEIEKMYDKVFNPIQVHPRYANKIIIK